MLTKLKIIQPINDASPHQPHGKRLADAALDNNEVNATTDILNWELKKKV